jgi:tetratricopeptide (TPR) repeat protein
MAASVWRQPLRNKRVLTKPSTGGALYAMFGCARMDALKIKHHLPALEHPDLFHYLAAEGWFELSNFKEASDELDQLTSRGSGHPDSLYLRWRILAEENEWDRCLVIGRTLTASFAEDPRSWITLAETFYRMGEVQKAYRTAAANAGEFPQSKNLLYDAACYACLVGKYEEAQDYFELARSARPEPRGSRVAARRCDDTRC